MSITTSTETEQAPLGWYPDPAGSSKLRLWNGSEWTDRLERSSASLQPKFRYDENGMITREFDY
jgi:hypothetical protein